MLPRAFTLTLGLLAIPAATLAHDYSRGDLVVDHPWSRATPPGTPVGVGYMTIHNHGDAPVVLVAGETPVAANVSIHETVNHDGMMKMQPLSSGLTIPAGETVELKPHSFHLMLEELEAPLKEGDEIPLTLTFEGLEPLDVMLMVDGQGDKPAMDHSGHSGHSDHSQH